MRMRSRRPPAWFYMLREAALVTLLFVRHLITR